MSPDVFYHEARVAVAHYMREIALFSSFPTDPSAIPETVDHHQDGASCCLGRPVLRVVATNNIAGQVLPHTEDAWLAIRPFQDISKSTLPAWATALLERRMSAVALLVRLAASHKFEWNATMDCGSQRPPVGSPQYDPRRSFWVDLLRDLNPDLRYDRSMKLERHLVALSHSQSPRFLLCVDSDPSQVDFGDLVDQFLWATSTNVIESSGDGERNVFAKVLTTCGFSHGPVPHRVIDLGLSFTTGKITHTMLAKLFDVFQRLHSSERRSDGIVFRFTTLRFGSDCSIQPKALETMRERWRPDLDLTSIYLSAIDRVKPAAVQACLVGLTSTPSSTLRRLGIAASECFPAFASLFRDAKHSTIEAVDVEYAPTDEHAAWLAFAFFHVDAQSSVTSLCLRTAPSQSVFCGEWIEAFERALQSHLATDDLTGEEQEKGTEEREGEVRRQRSFVTIKSLTPVKSHPYTGAKLLCKLSSDQELELVATVKKLIGVVVPGIGVSWVPAVSVLSSRSQLSNITDTVSPTQINGRIKSLAIDRTDRPELRSHVDQHISATLRLLSLVGEPLERLQLPYCRFNRDHLAQILRLCPNLKVLNLNGHCLTNISPLVDAYAADECQITCLSLSNPLLLTNHDDIPEQLTALLTQKRRLPLQQLLMHVISHRNTSVLAPKCTTEVATNLAIALTQNQHLRFVQLTALTPITVGEQFVLDRLPLEVTASLGSVPLAIDCKLAFLSIVQDKNKGEMETETKTTCTVWSRLDAYTLSRIFLFSRHAIARHILRCQ